jgi:hypothetical protein
MTAPLDPNRLATAMVAVFRDVAKEHWPWLRGDGWPAYDEEGQTTQVLVVSEIAARLAAEYGDTPTAEDLHPAAPWNDVGDDA